MGSVSPLGDRSIKRIDLLEIRWSCIACPSCRGGGRRGGGDASCFLAALTHAAFSSTRSWVSSGVIFLMIKCSLASAATGRFVSDVAPLCRIHAIWSWLCVFVLCVAGSLVNETVSSSQAFYGRINWDLHELYFEKDQDFVII